MLLTEVRVKGGAVLRGAQTLETHLNIIHHCYTWSTCSLLEYLQFWSTFPLVLHYFRADSGFSPGCCWCSNAFHFESPCVWSELQKSSWWHQRIDSTCPRSSSASLNRWQKVNSSVLTSLVTHLRQKRQTPFTFRNNASHAQLLERITKTHKTILEVGPGK